MGYSIAYNMAQQVDLETAVRWHLSANCYPPVPSDMAQICIDAIDAYLDGDSMREIDLPEGTLWRGKPVAPAYTIVENFRLDGIIDGINNRDFDMGDDWEE